MGAVREGGAIHTDGEWFAGGGSWVSTDHPIDGEIGGSDNVEYYGGHLIGESISSCNIPIISAAPDMFKALLAVKQKLHFIGMPGEKVCKVTGKSDWSDEIKLIEAALTKAVTRVPVPEKGAPVGVGEGWRLIGDDEVFIAGDEFDNNKSLSNPAWLDVEVCLGMVKRECALKSARCRRKVEQDVIGKSFQFVSSYDGATKTVTIVEEPETSKPPLGLMPRQMWLENRRDDIYDAIARYRAAGKDVSRDWLNELLDLDNEMRPF
jgi:hypothetical protein